MGVDEFMEPRYILKIPKRTVHIAGALALVGGIAVGLLPDKSERSVSLEPLASTTALSLDEVLTADPASNSAAPEPQLPELAHEKYLVAATHSIAQLDCARQTADALATYVGAPVVLLPANAQHTLVKVAIALPTDARAAETLLHSTVLYTGPTCNAQSGAAQGVVSHPFQDAYFAQSEGGHLRQLTSREIQQDILTYAVPTQYHQAFDAIIEPQISAESNWRATASSNKNAHGSRQVQPNTARDAVQWRARQFPEWKESPSLQYSDDTWRALLHNPAVSAQIGTFTLANYHARFGRNMVDALAAYNAGPGNVTDGDAFHFSETRKYVTRIMSAACAKSTFAECETFSTRFSSS